MTYQPQPIRTEGVGLDPELTQLVEVLAAHVHDLWAEKRIAEGWVHGANRDDRLRTHPCLVSFAELPEVEADYDRQIVVGVVKAIVALGFSIHPGERASG